MVKIRNVFGDEYRGKQGNAVYQKFYGKQVRRLWDGRKENKAPGQREQQARFKAGLAFYQSLTAAEREAVKEYLRRIGSDLTVQQWAIKVALSRPSASFQETEVIGNVIEWVQGWDAIGWLYRQKITITNSNSYDLTDYQVKLELTADNVGANFDWSRQGADLRFYDSAGNKLSYYVESWDEVNKKATIWVKVPLIPASGSTTIKMYYGNSTATSESNSDAVFEFFDDFSTDSNWTITDTNYIWINTTEKRMYYKSGTLAYAYVQLPQSYDKFRLVVKGVRTVSDAYGVADVELEDTPSAWGQENNAIAMQFDYSNDYTYLKWVVSGTASGSTTGAVGEQLNTPYTRVLTYDGSVATLRVLELSSDIQSTVGTIQGLSYLVLSLRNYAGQEGYLTLVYLTKYANVEPSATLGAEENGQITTSGSIKVKVLVIEQVGIKDVEFYDENGQLIEKRTDLSNVATGDIRTTVSVMGDLAEQVKTVRIISLAGTSDVLSL